MGWLRRIGIGLSAAAGWLGLTDTPETDEDRRARIAEMYEGYRKEFPDVPSISATELQRRLAQGDPLLLVDARAPAERQVSTLPGAVPSEAIEADPAAYVGRSLVAYCTIGYRSGLWAAKMRGQGLDVTNLEGSVLSWTHAGGELVGADGQPTRQVHVYGPTWDLAETSFEALW